MMIRTRIKTHTDYGDITFTASGITLITGSALIRNKPLKLLLSGIDRVMIMMIL